MLNTTFTMKQTMRFIQSVFILTILLIGVVAFSYDAQAANERGMSQHELQEHLQKRGFSSEQIEKIGVGLQNDLVTETGDETDEMRVMIQTKKHAGPYEGVFGVVSQGVDYVRNSMAESRVSRTIRNNGEKNGKVKNIDVATLSKKGITELSEDDAVTAIYPDRKNYPTLVTSVPALGAPTWWQAGYSGNGVTIAVIDSGIDDTHFAFSEKTIQHISVVPSNVTYQGDHGTHVASTAAANPFFAAPNGGVAPNASIIDVRVIRDEGYAYTSDVIAGIHAAIDPNNDSLTDDAADILSLSLGGAYATIPSLYREAIQDAIDAGSVVVVAAGNCGQSDDCNGFGGVTVPGRMKEPITVGAVGAMNSTLYHASFSGAEYISGEGTKPDVVAPGVAIDAAIPGNGMQSKSGTSMATPHVSGAAALIRERFPDITHDETKAMLKLVADDLGASGNDIYYGFGFVNMTILDLVLSNYEIVSVPLYKGANLVGFGSNAPMTLDFVSDTYPSSLRAIGEYQEETKTWNRYVPNLRDSFTNMSSVNESEGTFLLLEKNTTISFLARTLTDQDVSIKKGWNLVVYPFDTEQTVESYFSPVLDQISSVAGIKNQTQVAWYHTRFGDMTSTLSMLQPHYGYWVRADTNVTFTATP